MGREGIAIDEAILKQRLAAIESAVADLQRRLAVAAPSGNWLEKVIGSISDEDAFQEALEFGRAFRHADRPLDEAGDQP